MQKVITPDMTIEDIFSLFPHKSQKLAHVMTEAGLHCTNCSAATWETLEAGMLSHGFDLVAIEQLVSSLNKILMEKEDLSTISLTERAAEKFKHIALEEGVPEAGLRFGDQAGGCGGFQYLLDICEEADPMDQIFHSHGVRIFVDKRIVSRLMGSVIDYVEGLQRGSGFQISNPQAKSSCGCGQSQGY